MTNTTHTTAERERDTTAERVPSKKLPFGFLVILSAMSFHASSDSPPPPPQQQQQQQEKRGNTGRRKALKKLPLILFFVLSTITILRLLWITINTSSSSPAPLLWDSPRLQGCPTQSPGCVKAPPQASNNLTHHTTAPKAANLTTKEIHLLSDLISSKAPCNLLVFGLNPQFSLLVALNAGGTTIFLEDDDEKIRAATAKINATQIYKVEHNMEAGKAYELLRHARADPTCTPQAGPLQASGCPLALALLPKVVYERKWDVVLIDGPSGHNMEAPGRMAAIYSAGVMARTGNVADVLVHDIDRMVEKWYSWEFLCDENLVSSKGKLWHFRIVDAGISVEQNLQLWERKRSNECAYNNKLVICITEKHVKVLKPPFLERILESYCYYRPAGTNEKQVVSP